MSQTDTHTPETPVQAGADALPAVTEHVLPTAPTRWIVPPLDVLQKDGAWRLRADLPGVKAEGLSIDVEGHVLTLSAERHDRASLGWKRRVRLPDRVDTDAIAARLAHGVVEIDLPLLPEAAPRRIQIQGA